MSLIDLLHRRGGPLTRDLLRTPGGFGLGQVPARLAPEATARLVCGYCSTGCRLTAHLRGGEAVGQHRQWPSGPRSEARPNCAFNSLDKCP